MLKTTKKVILSKEELEEINKEVEKYFLDHPKLPTINHILNELNYKFPKLTKYRLSKMLREIKKNHLS